ncbi:hypothetical protein CERZMDRAFT_120336 [Cercospora zeae-maydis SCOH1-5]|uniref:Uncharacterized protein n=1 Tax=Cercospora zeae-maydis SCOH1-5 TaxID=717836 RepID=A0A6A6FMH4_9PEZI|nr:hypothetical protein CERZMDRAFT_120336 [Cercospora zeae-maydis SCOH1-5]
MAPRAPPRPPEPCKEAVSHWHARHCVLPATNRGGRWTIPLWWASARARRRPRYHDVPSSPHNASVWTLSFHTLLSELYFCSVAYKQQHLSALHLLQLVQRTAKPTINVSPKSTRRNGKANLSDPVTFDEAQNLSYLQAVIREALRMHPAVGLFNSSASCRKEASKSMESGCPRARSSARILG